MLSTKASDTPKDYYYTNSKEPVISTKEKSGSVMLKQAFLSEPISDFSCVEMTKTMVII